MVFRAQWLYQDVEGLRDTVVGRRHVVDEPTGVELDLWVEAVHSLASEGRGNLKEAGSAMRLSHMGDVISFPTAFITSIKEPVGLNSKRNHLRKMLLRAAVDSNRR